MNQNLEMEEVNRYETYLKEEERSSSTIGQYMRDLRAFISWSGTQDVDQIDKLSVITYKEELMRRYLPASVNTKIAALNGFFHFLGRDDLRLRQVRVQHRAFLLPEEMLEKDEYYKLIARAEKEGKERLSLILQTLCSTGIRVSELEYITVEAARSGQSTVSLKGKIRKILLPPSLCEKLLDYAEKNRIDSGLIFRTCSGKPVDRNSIWKMMNGLARRAGVNPKKAHPHNLRHLFARSFYEESGDLGLLADVLGHSNVNTTRIYTASTGAEHIDALEELHLVL